MSSVMRDLWPDDIRSEEVVSPEETLGHQAELLGEKTGGLLTGHVVRREAEDRVILGFEVEAPRAGSRIQLFEVQYRLDFEYPAAVVPPNERLPEFLKTRLRLSSVGGVARHALDLMQPDKYVDNPWVATSPTSLSEKVQDVLNHPFVKGVVLSLLSRASREQSGNG